MLLPNRTVQRYLAEQDFYSYEIDGDFGLASQAALDAFLTFSAIDATGWPLERKRVAMEQLMFRSEGLVVGKIDGLVGPQTRQAYEDYVTKDREQGAATDEVDHQPQTWPRQSEVTRVFGNYGENQVLLQLPYPMVLAWDTKTAVTRISLHRLVAPSAQRALEKIHAVYGNRIPELGLNLFGGSFNVRKMRGGSQMSMHSWGIAIDFDPENNQLKWGRDRARLARPEYEDFWKAWEDEGWISLGRERNYDWMHVQAARL